MRFVLVVVCLAAVLCVPAAAATPKKAHLAVVASAPASFRGTNFKPHEHVTVTLTTTTTHRKVVKANASGVFKATFAGLVLPRCESYTVVARGNRGSLASLTIVQECPPPAAGEQPLTRSARVSLAATLPAI